MTDPYPEKETPWRDASVLEELYAGRGMNTYEIADELGVTDTTIQKWLDEHGIKERKSINKERPWQNEDKVCDLYKRQKLTIPELAERLGCAYQTAYRWLKKHGIETRDRQKESIRGKLKTPPSHRTTRDGYEVVETSIDNSTKSMRIHRLIMIAEEGAEEMKGNIVHHKNGIPWDNRPSNLELMSEEEHGRHHNPVNVRWGNTIPREVNDAE